MWEILSLCLTVLISLRLILCCCSSLDSSSDGPSRKSSHVSMPWKHEPAKLNGATEKKITRSGELKTTSDLSLYQMTKKPN